MRFEQRPRAVFSASTFLSVIPAGNLRLLLLVPALHLQKKRSKNPKDDLFHASV